MVLIPEALKRKMINRKREHKPRKGSALVFVSNPRAPAEPALVC